MLAFAKDKVSLCFLIFVFLQSSTEELPNISSSTHQTAYSLRTKADCSTLSEHTQCACSGSSGQFHVDCASINMTLFTNEQVIIECDNNVTGSFHKELLPKLMIGSLVAVKLVNCSLSYDETVKNILNHLGIEDCETLIFSSNQTVINKHQLSELQTLTDLIFDVKTCESLPPDLFEGLPNLKYLQFYMNDAQLPRDLFDPLTNLNALLLGAASHSANLPAGLFQHLKNLGFLNIGNNKNLTITSDVFENATSISSLELENNNITSLPIGLFDHLTNLTFLKLIENPFNDLPNGLFRKTMKLQEIKLIINNGSLRTLPEEFLGNLTSLTDVQLSVGLETLPENLFKGSGNVKVIKLNGNKLRNLPFNLFKDQKNLKDLDLSDNLLMTLPDRIFSSTKYLKKLILSQNHLTVISDSMFKSLNFLETLSMDNNNLSSISKDAFRYTSLHGLSLSHNQLTTITESVFSDLCCLEVLWLDNNNLNFITNNAFRNTETLRYLHLEQNHLKMNSAHIFIDSMVSLVNIRVLNLRYNNITKISNEDLKFKSTQEVDIYLSKNQIESIDFSNIDPYFANNMNVDLSENPIRCDCRILNFVKYLKNQKNLKVDTNNLKCERPEKFKGKSLIQIDPCDLRCPINESKSCPALCQCEYRSCDNALIINCSDSNLFHFPTLPKLDFTEAKKIALEMQNNNLKNLPQNYSLSYNKVFCLNLSGNGFENIEASRLPENLEILDLRQNNLKSLSVNVLETWSQNASKLREIYLSQNSWTCDCGLKDLLEFIQNNHDKVIDRDSLQCLNSSNQYQDLMKITISQLCPSDTLFAIIIASVIAICGLMVGLLIAVYYSYNNEIKVWLYSHNMCLWFVSIQDLDKDKKYDGFISYSHKDKEFVQMKLLPFLEHGPLPFKICDHERDWLVGDTIPQQIIDSVEKSRRTIIILSDNYLDSDWGRMEFQAAHQLSLKERQAKLIIILYGELKNTEKLDAELKAYLKMNTYLEWDNPWFWEKLLYAMPHSKYSKRIREFSSCNQKAVKANNELNIDMN